MRSLFVSFSMINEDEHDTISEGFHKCFLCSPHPGLNSVIFFSPLCQILLILGSLAGQNGLAVGPRRKKHNQPPDV